MKAEILTEGHRGGGSHVLTCRAMNGCVWGEQKGKEGSAPKEAHSLGTEGSREMQIPGPYIWFCDSLGLGLELGIAILFFYFYFFKRFYLRERERGREHTRTSRGRGTSRQS